MKIIAENMQGCTQNYIVEVSDTELARMLGFYFEGSEGCPRFETGIEVNVGEIYRTLYDLQQQKNTVKEVAETLRSYADKLEIQIPALDKIHNVEKTNEA